MAAKKKAFTLAEVLITLAIIGVVAALIISSVAVKYKRKVVETQLLKSYNTILTAMQLSEVYNGSRETWDYDSSMGSTFFDKYFTPYIKGSGGTSKSVVLSNLGYKEAIKNPNGSDYIALTDEGKCIKINDGSIIFDDEISERGYMQNGTFKKYYASSYLAVDINGPKEPNILAQDVFVFEVVMLKDYPISMATIYRIEQTSPVVLKRYPKEIWPILCKSDAKYCGTLIEQNGWKIPDDYPYL